MYRTRWLIQLKKKVVTEDDFQIPSWENHIEDGVIFNKIKEG